MAYFIKESNQDNADLIHDFNKDLENHKINSAIGKLYDVHILNILQPAPIYKYSYELSNVPEDFLPEKDHESLTNVKLAYDIIKTEDIFNNSKNFLNLENININKAMYVDGFHYTPIFNEAIAKEIHNYLVENF